MYLQKQNIVKHFIESSPKKLRKSQEKNFAITALFKNNYFYNENEFIYLFYLENINSYEILVSSFQFKYFDVLFDKLENKNGYTLFISEKFFLIYFNTKPYYFQNLDNEISKDELILFIEKKLKISISNTQFIEKEKLDELLNNSSGSLKLELQNINESKKNLFKIYLLYLLTAFGIFFFYLTNFSNEKKELKPKIIEKENKFISFHEKFEDLKSKLKKYKLNIQTILYEKNSLKLIINSSKKSDIYAFLLQFKNSVSSSSISFNENLKIYECSVDVKKF